MQPRVGETFFIDKDILEKLKGLSNITRVNRSVYIREVIAHVLEKYKVELRKAKKERR